VIDTATNKLVTMISDGHAAGVAVTPNGKRAFVILPGRIGPPGRLQIIDTATNTEVALIPVGTSPIELAQR
jgi:DNA-binding beta-propeller fold protein YncE